MMLAKLQYPAAGISKYLGMVALPAGSVWWRENFVSTCNVELQMAPKI